MSDLKQVKVDNWGIYFLQRLKHFFNRTDYCDLTLQFQDHAQLKVHRLVLNACTEYFELLERTCEMYEDCLVMPDDLQADVVVPIVNFMYTGQLEFKVDLLDKLYQTSQIMNMPVLTKLLDAQRIQIQAQTKVSKPTNTYSAKRYTKSTEYMKQQGKQVSSVPSASSGLVSNKRSYSKAFEGHVDKDKKHYVTTKKALVINNVSKNQPTPPAVITNNQRSHKNILAEPRPTRYELPEELDSDNIFDSFSNISYESRPLMVHPEAVKHYQGRKHTLTGASSSKSFIRGTSTLDIVECKRVSKTETLFEDDPSVSVNDESEIFGTSVVNVKEEMCTDTNQLFDQILNINNSSKVTIETKDNKQSSNIDHAKIISEVLKKYPHLVKSNKNIKLKIINTPNKARKSRISSPQNQYIEEKEITKSKEDVPDFTYETDVLDSKEAARLISLGAENIKGPWICLICGTPGKALHFTSYYKYRRHLVDVHNEKPVPSLCEYCGLKSLKRNYLLHHMYTKHGIEPPPKYHFPKCNICNYVALTEGFLVKHKMTHSEPSNFRCNVCAAAFGSSKQLLIHIQNTGHRYSAKDKRNNQQCIYCLKGFLRETNLYAHLKTNHKDAARNDGVIDDSDDEKQEEEEEEKRTIRYRHKERDTEDVKLEYVKYEVPVAFDAEYDEIEGQYAIHERPDGNLQLVSKKHLVPPTPKQKILNAGFGKPIHKVAAQSTPQKTKITRNISNIHSDYLQDESVSVPSTSDNEEIIVIGDSEYVMRDNQLILRREKSPINEEFIISDMLPESNSNLETTPPNTSIDLHNSIPQEVIHAPKMAFKKPSNVNQPIQIVVSNDEEYKALMSSNHSIIFDDGDTNKTLTVLTAPHNAINTNVDLSNSQSNNMMIIQDHYPLTVSEAVSENSNIVVVYSHPVEDQNKEYELLTTQDIQSQYVPSSTVITQNYETVSTSTPVLSAQVIATQPEETWSNNSVQNINNQQTQINSEAELQEIAIIEQTEIISTANESNKNLEELPEVQLVHPEPKTVQSQKDHPEETQIQCDSTNNEQQVVEQDTVQTNVDEAQDISTPTMDDKLNSEVIRNESNVILANDDKQEQVIESELQHNISNENLAPQGQLDKTDTVCDAAIISNKEPEEVINAETGKEILNVQELEVIPENTTEECQSEQREIEQSIDNIVTTSIKSKDQIQNLTSEWSEDEDENEIEKEKDNTVTEIPETITTEVTKPSVEIEESIENIQQEMEKQMSEIVQEEVDTEDNLNMSQENNLTTLTDAEQPQTSNAGDIEAPQEKLSSILNDWEENDSQEENNSANGNDSEPPASIETSDNNITVEIEKISEEKNEIKKDDNIKSLVSDWDDDEEENKEPI